LIEKNTGTIHLRLGQQLPNIRLVGEVDLNEAQMGQHNQERKHVLRTVH
jgi:hypothetical protein